MSSFITFRNCGSWIQFLTVSVKKVTHSKQDHEGLQLLDLKALTLEIKGVRRLATPLLRHRDMPQLNAQRDSVLPNLHSVEWHLLKDPEKARPNEWRCGDSLRLELSG